MLDLTEFERIIEDLKRDDLNDFGKMNLESWLGERAYLLIDEIKRLRAKLGLNHYGVLG